MTQRDQCAHEGPETGKREAGRNKNAVTQGQGPSDVGGPPEAGNGKQMDSPRSSPEEHSLPTL